MPAAPAWSSRHAPAPGGATYLLLALLIFAWGSNYPLMKLAIGDMPPLAFTTLRLAGASFVLAVIILASGQRTLLPPRGERGALAVVGLFQMAAMFGFTILGLVNVPPGRAGLLVYTMQLWAVPLGVWLLGERPGRGALLGSVIGFAGILVFFNPLAIDWHRHGTLSGSCLILLAAVSWALGSCLYRRRRWRSSFMVQTLWQMAISILPLAVLSGLFERGAAYHVGARLVAILVFNWFVPTAFALWCWSKVLAVMPVSTAGQWLLLTPMFGFMLSALFMGEPITPTLIASAALIAAGIFLTMRSKVARDGARGRR